MMVCEFCEASCKKCGLCEELFGLGDRILCFKGRDGESKHFCQDKCLLFYLTREFLLDRSEVMDGKSG